jgi:hypothetical protein
VDVKEVDKTIEWLKSIYGEDMRVSRGKKHDYLGMDLDYSVPGEVKITMVDYLKRVITEFPEVISGGATSPAADRLFTVRSEDESKPLEEKRAIAFHHCVAQLLFASARARKDIQPSVAFLTTRVRTPDEDDWLKLKRLLKYIRSTVYLPLILKAESLNVIKWWVDASFATHDNCRGHTGATMSLGKGSIVGMSKKQKINTRSSTEAELVGADDAIPQMMWTRYFLEGQGYNVDECILNQDNMSAMLLETNGKQSSSKRTKHIRVRYFFIKDRVSNGDITLKHCPTGEMLADHFTKPLQGALFRKFRAEIQGIPHDTNEAELGWDQEESCEKAISADPSPQECVALKGKEFPRSKNTGLRDNYLKALRREGRQVVPTESALKTDSSEARKEDSASISTVRPARYSRWSKGVSYARALTGKA